MSLRPRRLGSRIARLAAACGAAATLSACAIVSYRNPDAPLERPVPRNDTLHYNVAVLSGPPFGGVDALKRSMRENGMFPRVELVDAPAAQGVTINVRADWVQPSPGATITVTSTSRSSASCPSMATRWATT
jgi:hypothetical protein